LEVCEGQQYDMNFENRDNVSESEYMQMIKLKTSVLIAGCLKAGAIVGGAINTDADHLYDFGLNIGLAFQLQDDLLDVYADSETFGKQTGNDIIAGKKTFLLINALEKADNNTKETLFEVLNGNRSKEDKINTVTNIYDQLNIRTLTENKIKAYHLNAVRSLESVSCDTEKKIVLTEFADQIMNRKK
jgi:geranylgeranyl diphosphate synthase type II